MLYFPRRLFPLGEVVVVHHFAQGFVDVADAVVVEPVLEIVGAGGGVADDFFVLQRYDEGIYREDIVR